MKAVEIVRKFCDQHSEKTKDLSKEQIKFPNDKSIQLQKLVDYGAGKRGDLKMIHEFNVVIERDVDGYFVASVPALRGCHTQAKSLDVLMKRIREAIELCLEVEEPITNEFVGIQRVTV